MALLAWLMLVSTSLFAAPMLMGAAGAPQAVPTASGHQHQGMAGMHQESTLTSDMTCCNPHMVQGCDCHSLCGNVLSPLAVSTPAPLLLAATHGHVFQRRAPAPKTVPPERPPSVCFWLLLRHLSALDRPIGESARASPVFVVFCPMAPSWGR
jgi:hypothetical protein